MLGRPDGRELEEEGRALAFGGRDPDAHVHPLHELAADVEPEPGASYPAGQVRVESVELLEDPPLLVERDADPLVTYGEADAPLLRLDADLDRAAVERVLHGVLDEVGEHLAHLVLVREHRGNLAGGDE